MAVETKNIVVTGYPSCARIVTPSDVEDLEDHNGDAVAMFVRAETAGAITVIPAGNQNTDTVTFALAAGEFVPCKVRRVLNTGTDVASITAVW